MYSLENFDPHHLWCGLWEGQFRTELLILGSHACARLPTCSDEHGEVHIAQSRPNNP